MVFVDLFFIFLMLVILYCVGASIIWFVKTMIDINKEMKQQRQRELCAKRKSELAYNRAKIANKKKKINQTTPVINDDDNTNE